MALTKRLWFFNFITYACLLYVYCPSVTTVHAIYITSFQHQEYKPRNNYLNYNKDRGLNYQCRPNVRVKKLTEPFIVGEGPFWSVDLRSLLFVDGARSTICRYAVHTEELFCAKLGNESVQDLIPLQNVPHKYFSTYGSNITIVSWDARSTQASLQTLRQPDLHPNHFVNDAKADSNGVVFFFTEPKVPTTGLGSIPRYQSQLYNTINGEQKTLLAKYVFGNGIGFSHDGKFLYHSDSELNCTYESYYDRTTNSIKYTRVLIDYIKEGIPCFPDSMTVDKEGYIWTTCNRGSLVSFSHHSYRLYKAEQGCNYGFWSECQMLTRLNKYTKCSKFIQKKSSVILKVEPHTGYILCSIKLPAVAPTNLAFGECPGKRNNQLNCIYVTTERIRLTSPTPYDGALYLIENSGSEGCPPNKVELNEIINEHIEHRLCGK